jgi:hypothetical protein
MEVIGCTERGIGSSHPEIGQHSNLLPGGIAESGTRWIVDFIFSRSSSFRHADARYRDDLRFATIANGESLKNVLAICAYATLPEGRGGSRSRQLWG